MHKQIRNLTPCITMYTFTMRDYACVNKDVFVIAVNSWFPSFGWRHLIEKMSPQSTRGNMVRRHGQPSTVLHCVYHLRISLMWPNGLTWNGTEKCWDVVLCANYSLQQQMAFKAILASEIMKKMWFVSRIEKTIMKSFRVWCEIILQCTFEEAFDPDMEVGGQVHP